LAATRSRSA